MNRMTNLRKKVLAICGSTKKNSSNHAILQFIAESFKEFIEVDFYDGVESLPHYNLDLDNENPPQIVADLRKRIDCSNGVVICSPEYVFSLPGSLKNIIEWNVTTTVFSNKPVAIIVASASGEKAFEALDLIMTTIESRIGEKSKLLIKGVKGKIGPNGEIQDQEVSEQITAVVQSLIRSMEEQDGVPDKYRQF